MSLEYLCPPAFLFFLYAFTQIIIDIFQGMFNTALLKFIISIVITIGLNYLCIKGFRIISWLIVFIPFVFLAVVTSILLFGLGLDPSGGKILIRSSEDKDDVNKDIRNEYKSMYDSHHHITKHNNAPDIFNYGVVGVTSDSNHEQHTPKMEEKTPFKSESLTKENNITEKEPKIYVKPDVSEKNTNTIQNKSLHKTEDQECTYGKYPLCHINTQIITDP